MFGRSELRTCLDTAPRRMNDLENGLGNLQPRVASHEFHMQDMQKKQEQVEKQLDRMIQVLRGAVRLVTSVRRAPRQPPRPESFRCARPPLRS